MVLLGHCDRVGVGGDGITVLTRRLEGNQVHMPAVELEDMVEHLDVGLDRRQSLCRCAGSALDR